ncbi:MAG: RNA methyltransferase [Bacteroidales bacterium]|nr:RNA methyltransferase [Bacteroidales bacterium]
MPRTPEQDRELAGFLSEFVMPERVALIDRVLPYRTRYVTVMLEDIYQSQNASAVMRTCDCLGVQDMYIVENRNEYTVNPWVVRGSDQWVTQYRFNAPQADNTSGALAALKARGYRIVATALHRDSCPLEDFDVRKGPFALVFGNEREGISPAVAAAADEFLEIPMCGFTESFNISVAAGICLYTLLRKVRLETDWALDEASAASLRVEWLGRTLKSPGDVIARFCRERGYSAE